MKMKTLKVLFVLVDVLWALVMIVNIALIFSGNVACLIMLILSSIHAWLIVMDVPEFYLEILTDIMGFVYDNFGIILWGSIAVFGLLSVSYSSCVFVNWFAAGVCGNRLGASIIQRFDNRA